MTTQTLPHPGAQNLGGGRAQFTLFAPRKKNVFLMGDFNDWQPARDRLAEIEEGCWALERELTSGEHFYQFIVDGQTICDPCARRVKLLGDRSWREPVPQAIIDLGQSPFEWKHDHWQRPPFRDLILYELHTLDFSGAGTFTAVKDKLPYFRDLGINALELMPVCETNRDEGWGYEPTYFFACKGLFGAEAELKTLIDEAHAQGIAIILDIVLSHTAGNHPFTYLYPYEASPWYGEGIGGNNKFGLPTLDHRKPATQNFARDVQHFWLEEYHIDGFRYDYAINIGIEQEKGLPTVVRQARTLRPDAYLIGEYLPEDPQVAGLSELNATWHVYYSYALKALVRQKEVSGYSQENFEKSLEAIDPFKSGYLAPTHMINYLESHDEQRLVYDLRLDGLEGYDARLRVGLAATILFTSPGVPMLYMGQEFGERTPRSINDRNPLCWELLATWGGKGLLEHFQKLIRIRQAHPALRADSYIVDRVHDEQKWVVYHRWNNEGDEVLVAANFANEPRRIPVPFPSPGRWKDLIRGPIINIVRTGDIYEFEFQPFEAGIMVKTEL